MIILLEPDDLRCETPEEFFCNIYEKLNGNEEFDDPKFSLFFLHKNVKLAPKAWRMLYDNCMVDITDKKAKLHIHNALPKVLPNAPHDFAMELEEKWYIKLKGK